MGGVKENVIPSNTFPTGADPGCSIEGENKPSRRKQRKVAKKNCKWMICERFLETPSSLTGQVSFVRKGKTRNVIDVSAHISRTNLENAIDPRPYVHCFGHPGGRADSLSWAA